MMFDSLKPNSIRDALIQSAVSAEAYAKRCRAAAMTLSGDRADTAKSSVKPTLKLKRKQKRPRNQGPAVGGYGHLWEHALTLPQPFQALDLLPRAKDMHQCYNACSQWKRKGYIAQRFDPNGDGGWYLADRFLTPAMPSEAPIDQEADAVTV